MLENLFTGIYEETSQITLGNFVLCMIAGIIIGIIIAYTYKIKTKTTKSFLVTLTTLPSIVAMVIIMVNGSIGVGVAVAGAFSLVRFRSAPGTAKEIGALFIAMGAGLAIGMGYIGYAFVFVIIITISNMLLNISSFGETSKNKRIMTITIPEDLNYTNVFNDIFEKYTKEIVLTKVKTTNMGSLFKLSYDLELEEEENEKDFIDEIRIRNGNLDIVVNKQLIESSDL